MQTILCRLKIKKIMSKVSTIGFGAGGVFMTKADLANVEKSFTSGALGTEIAQGTFGAEDGLVVSDSNPVFIPDKGQLSDAFKSNSFLATDSSTPASVSAPPTPPSTRPYIWKYQ
jgi:hypothetical protein